jgi:2-hydroxy-3-oxopropionate reductase
MSTVAFVGLGIMGAPMAGHLLRAGHDVIGINRSQPAVSRFLASGGRTASTLAEAVSQADVIVTMVPDSADVEALALGAGGIYAAARPGALHIDCSTIRPDVAARLAAEGAAKGVRVIDAPVSGGEVGAGNATLSIMVGGEVADVTAAMPILQTFGQTVVHVGAAGAGQTVKAANQLIVAGTIGLVAEAIVFLEAHSVNVEAGLKVLAGGLAGNRILDVKSANMVKREFVPGFRIDLHHKDLGIVLSAAREAGVVVPLGALTAQLLAAARAAGHGDLDHSALLLTIDQLSGGAAV